MSSVEKFLFTVMSFEAYHILAAQNNYVLDITKMVSNYQVRLPSTLHTNRD